MEHKQELQQRIIQGIRRVNNLVKMADRLQKGKSRGEVDEELDRQLIKLNELEDGFIELYPGECLVAGRRCEVPAKGCFPCWHCGPYLNALYGDREPVTPKLF